MRRQALLLLSALIAAAAVHTAAAQKFIPKNIRFNGDPEYSAQELMQAAGLKNGEVLSYVSMNNTAQQLMSTGMFDGVTFKFDGQDLVFYLTPASQLLPVNLENLPLPAGEDVNAKLHGLLPLYHGKVPATGGLMDAVRQDLDNMLTAEGIHADVEGIASGNLGATKATAMAYSVVSPPVTVNVAHIDGVSPQLQTKVQAILADVAKNPFDADVSAGNLEHAVELFYEDQGYAAAKVQAVRSGNAVVTADSIQVPFAVTVQEGRVYKLAGVHAPAGAPITQAELDKALAPGGLPQGVRLRGAWQLIARSYKKKGYLDCKITPHPQFDEAAGTVSYTVDVVPGPVYHLAFAKFDTPDDTMRRMLMRYWQMMPGDVFDHSYVENFIPQAQIQDRNLARLLYGTKIRYIETEDLENHTVNLVIQVREPSQTAAQ